MGQSLSWIAISGRDKTAVLSDLGLEDTGVDDPENVARLSVAELPDGWLLLFSDDLAFASPQQISMLSAGGFALGCAIEEHVMFSGVRAYADGEGQWSVIHDAEEGVYHLKVGGQPPSAFEAIRSRLTSEQDKAGGEKAGVDMLFDVPIELAKAVCGYRSDDDIHLHLTFTALAPPRSGVTKLLGRLFGAKG